MKARILVIEDEPAINNLLCMNLEVTGYQTVATWTAMTPAEGIAWDHEFQCALVDIMLPWKRWIYPFTRTESLRHSRHFSHRQSRHRKQSKKALKKVPKTIL